MSLLRFKKKADATSDRRFSSAGQKREGVGGGTRTVDQTSKEGLVKATRPYF